MVERCMQLLSTVGDAVLSVTLPDEEAISIQTSDLSFTLGRYTPARLSGLKINIENGKFVLPVDSNALVRLVANNEFVDAQVITSFVTCDDKKNKYVENKIYFQARHLFATCPSLQDYLNLRSAKA